MAKVSIVITAEVPEEDLNYFWENPGDLVSAGYNAYFSADDIKLYRVGGVIIERNGWYDNGW